MPFVSHIIIIMLTDHFIFSQLVNYQKSELTISFYISEMGLYVVLDLIVCVSSSVITSMCEKSARQTASSPHAQVEDHPDL